MGDLDVQFLLLHGSTAGADFEFKKSVEELMSVTCESDEVDLWRSDIFQSQVTRIVNARYRAAIGRAMQDTEPPLGVL